MRDYTPADWYWRRDDGAIFASARQAIVDEAEGGYAAFVADGNQATRWPVDDAGQQTDAALRDVLAPYGLALTRAETMLAALADRRWRAEVGGITVAGLAVPTDRTTQDRVDQIVKAYDDGDITGEVDFKAGGVWVTLSEAELRAIKAAGAQHIQACFSHERALAEAIAAAEDDAALDAIDIETGWPQ